jgi:hypothetical protein
LPCSAMVKIREKVFLQALQKNSYWGIRASTGLKGDGRILDPWVGRFNMGQVTNLRERVADLSGGLGRGFCVGRARVSREVWVSDFAMSGWVEMV